MKTHRFYYHVSPTFSRARARDWAPVVRVQRISVWSLLPSPMALAYAFVSGMLLYTVM